MISSISLLIALTAAGPTPAVPTEKNPAAGHSIHGEAFNEGPRQHAALMPGMPAVHLAISTAKPEAQKFFDQGIGQLHGFWYFEAERSFREAAFLDPNAPMPYVGMAMANLDNDKRAKGFIAKAVERKKNASPREVRWIDAVAAFVNGTDGLKKRRQFVQDMENLLFDFPEELEAKAFLIGKVWEFSGFMTPEKQKSPLSSRLAVDALIDQVLVVAPLHPGAHHYRIHLWDHEKPERALSAAAKGGPSGPGIAHLWHMPGHIYADLKRYDDAAWQQAASAAVDHAYMMRDHVMPYQIHNYAHNNQWLATDFSHAGAARLAIGVAKNLVELPRHPKLNDFAKDGSAGRFGRARLLEVLERYELWDDAIALGQSPYLEPTDLPAEQVKRLRLLGYAWFNKKNAERGSEIMASLVDLMLQTRAAADAARKKAEEKAKSEKKTPDQIAKAMTDAAKEHDAVISQIEKALNELTGHRKLLAGDAAGAWEAFDRVKEMRKTHLARLRLQAGQKDMAEKLAREAVDAGKGETPTLAAYIDILYQVGKKDDAKERFKALRPTTWPLDRDLPPFARLIPIAKELGIADDWSQPSAPRPDVGPRPPLDSLGPLAWQPVAAPEWSLPAGDGRTVALRDHAGKPVLLLFYLGHGCTHCVQQLTTFAPRAAAFQKEGIAIVAISTDPPEQLSLASVITKPSDVIPFPLLSDAPLNAFKAYRAFDDFESKPLHATVLVDGAGRIRWQEIGHEPFTDSAFLLRESKRLLAIPTPPLPTPKQSVAHR